MDHPFRKYNQSASKIKLGSISNELQAGDESDGILTLVMPDLDGETSFEIDSLSNQTEDIESSVSKKIPQYSYVELAKTETANSRHVLPSNHKRNPESKPATARHSNAKSTAVLQTPKADVTEDTKDWSSITPNKPQRPGQSGSESNRPTTDVPDAEDGPANLMKSSVTEFSEQNPILLEQFKRRQQAIGCQLVILSDVEEPSRSADVTVKLAFELASRNNWRVLVIDADTKRRVLSRNAFNGRKRFGITDLFRGECDIGAAISKTENPLVQFMPCGQRPLNFSMATQAFETVGATTVGIIRREFDFVCITTGSAFDSSLSFWGKFSDSTYLTLDPTSCSRALSKAAVAQLQKSGKSRRLHHDLCQTRQIMPQWRAAAVEVFA
ncbi:MAG: hypothetical protein R3C03_11830 [Pirellulaceae bacterium]